MMEAVKRFYSSLGDSSQMTDGVRIEFFAYFLTEEAGKVSASIKDIQNCFVSCDLAVPKSIPQYLNRGLSTKPKKFVKVTSGYKIERHYLDELRRRVGVEVHAINIPADLRQIEMSLPEGNGRNWFKEALDCFGIEAYRASLMMMWIFCLDHLYSYIMKHKLEVFNQKLSEHPDSKMLKKVGKIENKDEFTLIKEVTFLEICGSAKIISADVKKIMNSILDIRNSAAHPSGIVLPRTKCYSCIEDIMRNVVLKYKI